MSLLDFIVGILPLKQTFLVNDGVILNGSFTCKGSIMVMGRIDGNVSTDAKMIIAENGIVNGNIETASLIVKGTVTGNIYCAGKMIVAASADIKGDIIAGELELEKRALVDGSFSKLAEKSSDEVKDFIMGLTAQTDPVIVVKKETAIKPTLPAEELPKEKSAETWF